MNLIIFKYLTDRLGVTYSLRFYNCLRNRIKIRPLPASLFFGEREMNKDDIRIITYVTQNYMTDSRLPASIEKAGLKFDISYVYDAKAVISFEDVIRLDEYWENRLWNVNTNHKPYVMKSALVRFPEPIIWWTDWDSKLCDPEKLIRDSIDWYIDNNFDIGVVPRETRPGEIHYNGGSIFMRNCPATVEWLDEWIRYMEDNSRGTREQYVMNHLIWAQMNRGHLEKSRLWFMPVEFCKVFDTKIPEEMIPPVWLHHQASRAHNPTNPHYQMSRNLRDRSMIKDYESVTNDLFRSDFKIEKESVVICGTAENARGLIDRIPKDAYKIACNAAITIDEIDWDMWICVDNAIPAKSYFWDNYEKFKGVKVFKWQHPTDLQDIMDQNRRASEKVVMMFNSEELTRYPIEGDDLYRILCLYTFKDRTKPCIKGELRNGATVAAFGLQIAWYYGIKNVYLWGIAMSGNRYMAGEPINPAHMANAPWDNRIVFQAFINRIKNDGVSITTLTPTELHIKYPDFLDEMNNPVLRKGSKF